MIDEVTKARLAIGPSNGFFDAGANGASIVCKCVHCGTSLSRFRLSRWGLISSALSGPSLRGPLAIVR